MGSLPSFICPGSFYKHVHSAPSGLPNPDGEPPVYHPVLRATVQDRIGSGLAPPINELDELLLIQYRHIALLRLVQL